MVARVQPSGRRNNDATMQQRVDSLGRCSLHPFVQLRRKSRRSGEWVDLLDCCPLCRVDERAEERSRSRSPSRSVCSRGSGRGGRCEDDDDRSVRSNRSSRSSRSTAAAGQTHQQQQQEERSPQRAKAVSFHSTTSTKSALKEPRYKVSVELMQRQRDDAGKVPTMSEDLDISLRSSATSHVSDGDYSECSGEGSFDGSVDTHEDYTDDDEGEDDLDDLNSQSSYETDEEDEAHDRFDEQAHSPLRSQLDGSATSRGEDTVDDTIDSAFHNSLTEESIFSLKSADSSRGREEKKGRVPPPGPDLPPPPPDEQRQRGGVFRHQQRAMGRRGSNQVAEGAGGRQRPSSQSTTRSPSAERKRQIVRSRSAEIDDEVEAVTRPDPEECSLDDRPYMRSNHSRRSSQSPSTGSDMPPEHSVQNGAVSRRHSSGSAGRSRSSAPRLMSRQQTHPSHVQHEAQLGRHTAQSHIQIPQRKLQHQQQQQHRPDIANLAQRARDICNGTVNHSDKVIVATVAGADDDVSTLSFMGRNVATPPPPPRHSVPVRRSGQTGDQGAYDGAYPSAQHSQAHANAEEEILRERSDFAVCMSAEQSEEEGQSDIQNILSKMNTNEYDSKGRCVRHPHVRLRKKKMLGKGWKVLMSACPECCVGELKKIRKAEKKRRNTSSNLQTIIASQPQPQPNLRSSSANEIGAPSDESNATTEKGKRSLRLSISDASDSEPPSFVAALDESPKSSDGDSPTQVAASGPAPRSSASPTIRHSSFNSCSSAPLPFTNLPFSKKSTPARRSSSSTLETESVSMSSYSRSSLGSGSRRSSIESNQFSVASSSRRGSGGSFEVAPVVPACARRAEQDFPEGGRAARPAEPVRERSSRSKTAERETTEEDAADPPERSGRSRSRTAKREPAKEDTEDNEPLKASERTSRSSTSKRERSVSRSRFIAAAVRNIRSSRSRSRSRARDKSQGRDRSSSRSVMRSRVTVNVA